MIYLTHNLDFTKGEINLNKAEEECTVLLQVFANVPEIYDQNWETISECNKEVQDLLHEIEFSENQTPAGGYKLYKALREVRRRRRQCKDENELLSPLVESLKQQETFRLKLFKVSSQIKELARMQGERVYRPRVRTGMDTEENYDEE
jgi:hypothetical protein